MVERGYDLHGVRLGLSFEDLGERASAALLSRLARIVPDGQPPHDLAFELRAGAGHPFGRPDGARTVYEPPVGEVVYSDGAGLLYIDSGPRLRVLCDPGDGRARVSVLGEDEEDLWLLSHPLFTIPLMEMLKRRGLYGLHAGGLARNGRALLLPGTSGAGKSTLTLALARAGFGLLGDDTLFLARRTEGDLRVLAFPDEFDLTDRTVSFFPELAALLEAPLPAGWRKRQLRAEEVYGTAIVWEAEPALLVFPRVSGARESVLTPLSKEEALLELVPNVLLTEPRSSQAHLDALADLAAGCACYRLETGSDLDGAVRLLGDLLP
ncbi:MAG TPA: hypothetical protein VJ725_25535 [Thermoanaerobaculia bacterium]|nr:hypothetical protein [Thermoanaerobaculia bacterium]